VDNLILVSSAPIARLGDRKYYDFLGTLEVMRKIYDESVVDSFELQLEPEWDRENPPLTDAELADWTKTPKYVVEEIFTLLKKEEFPILSVHASRDIGTYLCSNQERDVNKGKRLINDSLFLSQNLGAEVCVFHLWDTWKTNFDINNQKKIFTDIAAQFPKVKASVENIPTHLEGCTPFSLVRLFNYVTLDLRWASLYNELDAFEQIAENIVNVHLRGRLENGKWVLDHSSFGFYDALDKIRTKWKHSGLLTVEPEGKMNSSHFKSFVKAMRSLRI
jgi:hypothetical protein